MTVSFYEYIYSSLNNNPHASSSSKFTIFFYVGLNKLFFQNVSDKEKLVTQLINKVFHKLCPNIIIRPNDQAARVSLEDLKVIINICKSREDEVISLIYDSVRKSGYKEVGKGSKVVSKIIYNKIITSAEQLISVLPIDDSESMAEIIRNVVARSVQLNFDHIKQSSAYKLLHMNGRQDADMWVFSQFLDIITTTIFSGCQKLFQEDLSTYLLNKGFISKETTFLDLEDVFFNRFLPSLDFSELTTILYITLKSELEKSLAQIVPSDEAVACSKIFTELQKSSVDEITDKMLLDVYKTMHALSTNLEFTEKLQPQHAKYAHYYISSIFNFYAVHRFTESIRLGLTLMYSKYIRATLIQFFNTQEIENLLLRAYEAFDYSGVDNKITKEIFQLIFPDLVITILVSYTSLEFSELLLRDSSNVMYMEFIMKALRYIVEDPKELEYGLTDVLSVGAMFLVARNFAQFSEFTSGSLSIDIKSIKVILKEMRVDDSYLKAFLALLYKHLNANQNYKGLLELSTQDSTLFMRHLNDITKLFDNTIAVNSLTKHLDSDSSNRMVLVNCVRMDEFLQVIRQELFSVFYDCMMMNFNEFIDSANALQHLEQYIISHRDEFLLMINNVVVCQVYKFLRHGVQGNDYLHAFDSKNRDNEYKLIMSYVLFIINTIFVDNQLTPDFFGITNVSPVFSYVPPLCLVRSHYDFENKFKEVVSGSVNNSISEVILKVIDGKSSLALAIKMINNESVDNKDYKLCIASIIFIRVLMCYTFKNILRIETFNNQLYSLDDYQKLFVLFNAMTINEFNIFLYKTCLYNVNSLVLLALCKKSDMFDLETGIILKLNILMSDVNFMKHIEILAEACFSEFKLLKITLPQKAVAPVEASIEVDTSVGDATDSVQSSRRQRRRRNAKQRHFQEHMLKARVEKEEDKNTVAGQDALDQVVVKCSSSEETSSEKLSDEEDVKYSEEEKEVISTFLISIPSIEAIIGSKLSQEQIEKLTQEHLKTYRTTRTNVRRKAAVVMDAYDAQDGGISSKDSSMTGKISCGIGTEDGDAEDQDALWNDPSISCVLAKQLDKEAMSTPLISFFWSPAFDLWLQTLGKSERIIVINKFKDMQFDGLSNFKLLHLNLSHKVYEFKILSYYRIYFIKVNNNVYIIHAGSKKNQSGFLNDQVKSCLSRLVKSNSYIQ